MNALTGKKDGPLRGFDYLSLFSDPKHSVENLENYGNFATFNRIFNTKTIIIQMGPTILNFG